VGHYIKGRHFCSSLFADKQWEIKLTKPRGGTVMYNRILVPLDGSKLSAEIVPYVRWLARALNAPVELLHVNAAAHLVSDSWPIQGSDYLHNVAASLAGIVNVKCTLRTGIPADVIIDLASAEPRTLIAMATHGYSGTKRWLLGSVAEKVLHALAGDLLLVRPEETDGSGDVQLKTILAPLDGSELAEKALPTVSELAKRLGLEVLLVHVTKRVYAGAPEGILPVFGAHPNLQELWEQEKAEASKYLTIKIEELRGKGIASVSPALIDGGVDGAAAEIIDLAERISGSLIIITSHGRSGIGRWLIGSVTERVVRHSRGPVLVIRPQT
jgi:nucleotide-binding universal stress UspA family protein